MKLRLYTTAIILVALVSSCTDVIQLELDDPKPLLVVDGYLTNQDTTQVIKLSSLENYFNTKSPNYKVFKTSVVTLIENGNAVSTYAYNNTSTQFELQYKGLEGKEYQIDIVLPDGTHYLSATELMEPSVPIDSVWGRINQSPGGPGPRGGDITVLLNTHEPIGLGDNYQWKAYINGEYQSDRHDLFFQEDRLVDGQFVEYLEVFGMSEKKYLEYKDNASDGRVFVKIEQSRVSYRYFKYLLLVYQQLNQVGGPFSAPPAEIRGNIYKQGADEVLALGYFHTAAIHAKTTELKE